MVIIAERNSSCHEIVLGTSPIYGIGTGFHIDNHIVVSAAHIYGEALRNSVHDKYTICLVDMRGNIFKAEVIDIDSKWDALFLKVENSGLPLNIYETKITIGKLVLAAGIAYGTLKPHFSLGIISGVGMVANIGDRVVEGLIYSDTSVLPGMSGGPLIDLHGSVIGMIIGSLGQGKVSLSVPISRILSTYSIIKKYGKVVRPKLGIKVFMSMSRHIPVKGLKVIKVEPFSLAERCGIKDGDIIVKINNRELLSIDDLWDSIDEAVIKGEKISIEFVRISYGRVHRYICEVENEVNL